MRPQQILAPFFAHRPNSITRGLPFAAYQRIPALNHSILKEATPYEMLLKVIGLSELSESERALAEITDADLSTVLERVEEAKPRTTPRNFVALVRAPGAGDKISAAQRELCTALASGPLDTREFSAATVKACADKGYVNVFTKEVAETGVSPQVKESRALALAIGDITHKAVLEPHLFDTDEWESHFQLSPTKGITTAAALEALAADPSRQLVTPEIIDTARRCRDAAYKHKFAAQLLRLPGSSEVTVEAWDEELQIMRKCRVDRLPDDKAAGFVDLKTHHGSLLEQPFKASVYKFGYGTQMAYYLDTLAMAEGAGRGPAYLLGVTKQAPFIARVFEVTRAIPEVSFIDRGRDIYLERASRFVQAYVEENWEAYENDEAFALTT